ncbi:hypothetical protein BK660_09350 [Pseudomonas brassicacearum]|jgi:hypothetical protein|uniref:Uncharacterized protein n=1 Tax=Pseudomonas brassicacearum TaxID=930166 RepID=A0A423I8K5_9PSED|nr:hypothetical protein [Pseudomonas brassicacearum]RON21776.1 hypothetical protein BK660_09350 [Pseudomonas brassicacearum]
MNFYTRFAMCLSFHAAGCLAYAFLNDAVVHAYKHLNGGFTSHGVAIGMASYALFYIFLGVNLVAALIPSLIAKLVILALMVGFILLWMLPENPLRALFYGVAQGCVTLLAILATQVIELRWALRNAASRTQPIQPEGTTQ